jgi:hypothetical protein
MTAPVDEVTFARLARANVTRNGQARFGVTVDRRRARTAAGVSLGLAPRRRRIGDGDH